MAILKVGDKMNIQSAIVYLCQIQAKRSNQYISQFEETLATIAGMNDPTSIVLLSHFFNDDTEFDELMFSIIHTIEIFDDDTYAREIIKVFPSLYKHSPRWASIILMRILNSECTVSSLVTALCNGTKEQRDSILSLMNKINSVSGEFLEKTQPIVKAIS